MSIEEYRTYCQYRGEHILTWLRDGDYDYSILMDMTGDSENTFKDVLALLSSQNLIELYDNDTTIRITNPGRSYLINQATDIQHVGEGILHKKAYVGGKKPNLPKELANNVHYFKSHLSPKQKKSLIIEIKEHGISTQPTKILSFLEGNNDVKFTIDKLHHMAYLLARLKEEKLIEYYRGNGYFKHFENAIYHDSGKMVNNGMAEMKRQVLDDRYDTKQASTIIDAIILKLKGR